MNPENDFENVFDEPSQKEEMDLFQHLTQSQAICDEDSDGDDDGDDNQEVEKVSDQNNHNLVINTDGAQKSLPNSRTLQVDGIDRQPKSTSRSLSEKKRQKISNNCKNQVTLTQGDYFSKRDPSSTRKIKDTDDTKYLVVNGTLKPFKLNEAFKIKGKEGCVFVIRSFHFDKGYKKAKGLLFRKWNSTFIGNIKYASPFDKYVDEFKLECNQYVKYEEEQSFSLRKLGVQLVDFDAEHESNNKILYHYHAPPKGAFGADSHGFTFSYRHLHKDEDFPEEFWAHVDLDKIEAQEAEVAAKTQTPHKSQSPTDTMQMIINRIVNELGKLRTLLKSKDAKIDSLQNEIQSYNSLKASNKPKIKVLDVFGGGGGMSCGLIQSGFFDVTYAVENNHRAAATFRRNHPDTFLFEEDVYLFLEKVKASEDGPYKDVLNSDHLHFSPPCQAFSRANPGGSNDATNAALTLFCIDMIKYFYENGSMKSISMENVTGLLRPEKGIDNYMKCVMSSLFAMGMDVKLMVMESQMYGDPQKRSRVFITAWKPELKPMRFPQETHGIHGIPVVKTSDVLEPLSRVAPTKGNGLVSIPSSAGSYQIVENHCIEGTELTADQKEIQADKPAHTIKRSNNIRHYEHPRRCTIRELATLMGFPYDFNLSGSRTDQINVLGNAVPVGMSTAFGLELKEIHK